VNTSAFLKRERKRSVVLTPVQQSRHSERNSLVWRTVEEKCCLL